MFRLTQLTSLDLSFNNLKTISSGTIGTMLPSLLSVDISNNRIKILPNDMCEKEKNQELEIIGGWKQGKNWRIWYAKLEKTEEKVEGQTEEKVEGQTEEKQQGSEQPTGDAAGVEEEHSGQQSGMKSDSATITSTLLRRHRSPLSVGEFPPIEAQLFSLSTNELRMRLVHHHRIRLPPTSTRTEVMTSICRAMRKKHDGGLTVRRMEGILISEEMAERLLGILRGIEWVEKENERPRVNSGGYIVVKREVPNVEKLEKGRHAARVARMRNKRLDMYRELWDAATECLREVDSFFASTYSDLAVTKNFIGSPHVDKNDLDAQWAVSLGGYGERSGGGGGGGGGEQSGGELCVEEAPGKVVALNTFRRLAKMDGRFVHWVNGYEGERYSLVFYRTEGEKKSREKAVCF